MAKAEITHDNVVPDVHSGTTSERISKIMQQSRFVTKHEGDILAEGHPRMRKRLGAVMGTIKRNPLILGDQIMAGALGIGAGYAAPLIRSPQSDIPLLESELVIGGVVALQTFFGARVIKAVRSERKIPIGIERKKRATLYEAWKIGEPQSKKRTIFVWGQVPLPIKDTRH